MNALSPTKKKINQLKQAVETARKANDSTRSIAACRELIKFLEECPAKERKDEDTVYANYQMGTLYAEMNSVKTALMYFETGICFTYFQHLKVVGILQCCP